ncbi:unnamed protein product, partial [Phyllotreta striolata]
MHMNIRQYFRWEILICRICGGWIHVESSKFDYLYYLYWAVINISTVIYILQKIKYVTDFAGDTYGIVGAFFILPISMTANVRSYSFFKYRKEFNELFTSLDEDIFQPQDANELAIMSKMLKFFSFYQHVLYVWSGVTMTGCQMGKLVFGVSDQPDDGQEHCEAAMSTKHGLFVYLYQTMCVTMLLVFNLISDLFMVGFCLFLGAQCDRLSYMLENLKERDVVDIKALAEYYKRILRFASNVEKLFGTIYFTFFFACLAAYGTTLFMFSITEPLSFRYFHMIEYICAIFGMLFTPCWFGTTVRKKSEKLQTAAYSANWVDSGKNFKNDLLIFMSMVQSPIQFRAWNLIPLNLESYMGVVKTSFSYYTVLDNMIMKKE